MIFHVTVYDIEIYWILKFAYKCANFYAPIKEKNMFPPSTHLTCNGGSTGRLHGVFELCGMPFPMTGLAKICFPKKWLEMTENDAVEKPFWKVFCENDFPKMIENKPQTEFNQKKYCAFFCLSHAKKLIPL